MDKYSTLLIAVAGAWLYFTGWAYLYSYYSYFGVSLGEIDPSIQYVLMHSLTPWYFFLSDVSIGGVVAILGIYAIIVIALRRLFSSDRLFAMARRIFQHVNIFVIAALILFVASLFVARSEGRAKAEQEWLNPSRLAYFAFKKEDAHKSERFYDLNKLNEDWNLRYLFSTPTASYVFYRDRECMEPYCGLVFRIQAEDVYELIIIHQ